MKRRICGILLIGALLLTACSTAGTSSEASAVSVPSSTVESKAEASSTAEVSSGTTASSTPEPIQYMSYEEYFSEHRLVEPYDYFRVDDYNYLRDGDAYVLPFPPEGRSGLGLYAQTKTGLLYLVGYDVYLITKAGGKAEMVYTGGDSPYRPYWISKDADEYVFFTIDRKNGDPSKFRICRVFRPTGQIDVVATDEDIPGEPNVITPYTNSIIYVESSLPYERKVDWTEDEAYATAEAAKRTTMIDMTTGFMVCSEDEEAYNAAQEKVREMGLTNAGQQ